MDNKDTAHVLQCAHPDATTFWNQSIDCLKQCMTTNLGHPELIELIVLGLQDWQTFVPLPMEYDILEPSLVQTYKKQGCIG
jgi:hypothetical protein